MTPESRTLLRETLVRDEGIRLATYQDTLGYWTIGVGRLIDARKGGGISRAEAMLLLDNDLARTMTALDQHLPWWRRLDEVRQRILINMSFNIGVSGLLRFHMTLEAIEDGRYDDAADAMLESRWANQVGARAFRLSNAMRIGKEVIV